MKMRRCTHCALANLKHKKVQSLFINLNGAKDPIALLRQAMRYSGRLFQGRRESSPPLLIVNNNIYFLRIIPPFEVISRSFHRAIAYGCMS